MKIYIVGDFFTTSGYSTALRGYTRSLLKREDVELHLNAISISGDRPLPDSDSDKYNDIKSRILPGIPKDADIALFWGTPDVTRNLVNGDFGKDTLKMTMISWECDTIPHLWKDFIEKNFDVVLTPSVHSLMAFDLNDTEVDILFHGVDTDIMYKKDIKKDDGVFRVLYTGTWIRRKAPMETLISLVLGLKNTKSEIMIKLDYKPESIMNIVTSIKSQLMRIPGIKRSQLPKIRIYNGTFTDDEMCDLYNIADVVVLTSHGEACGLPLLSAMATGTPIITTSMGGQIDYIPHGYKYLVPVVGWETCQDTKGYYSPQFGLKWHVVDFTKIQDHVRELHDMSPEERDKIGEELMNYVTTEFNWDMIVNDTINYIYLNRAKDINTE